MVAVEVGGELDLVHGHEGEGEVARHGLDGGDPVACPVGLDLLLARHESDVLDARPLDHALVDLARQEPQGQADHAALVAEHALDGEMRLAGVGGAQHGRDAARARLRRQGAAGRPLGTPVPQGRGADEAPEV